VLHSPDELQEHSENSLSMRILKGQVCIAAQVKAHGSLRTPETSWDPWLELPHHSSLTQVIPHSSIISVKKGTKQKSYRCTWSWSSPSPGNRRRIALVQA